jgi:hypothetical protein
MQNAEHVNEINKNTNNPRTTRNKVSCEMVMSFSEVVEVSIFSVIFSSVFKFVGVIINSDFHVGVEPPPRLMELMLFI